MNVTQFKSSKHNKFAHYLFLLKLALSVIKLFCWRKHYKPVLTDHQSKRLYCQDCRLFCMCSNKLLHLISYFFV